ncbi:DUF3575 domain-containing protein [Algoriphagus halophytocola]|uniref:DUF3575 domain-containing protein n=1 Tax=Algoriphagus halophytocola TaxID=2991499 RepID=A0ABY6MNQ4_9BACT|nr:MULTISPECIES: DUF3575 domain-containing protein [unclassified Algoriphagus]UZD24629.1 DUF3575 domain-containing protein [Algoriphagus sp. TR-M5]WBL41997.1 DUF3575 domain-containing protein [Algoriphagus sp. TR-M9]
MKKSIFTLSLILGLIGSGYAQEVISSSGNPTSTIGPNTNEVHVNFVTLIWFGSLEVGYERYLSNDHSLEFKGFINDRFGFNNERNGKKYKTNSVQASMNFYFGDDGKGRFFLYPLAKFRFGDFEEEEGGEVVTTDMSAFILGAGAGYKWELSENFSFGPFASISRNFSDDVSDRFSGIEFNAGFNLGYRF